MILAVVVASVLTLISVVTGVVASVPLVPEELVSAYQHEAGTLPGEGISYEQLVALDAVRFRQDFSQVTPATIRETRDFFEHCVVKENPETGQEETECTTRSLESVMSDLRFTEADREYVRQMIASLSPRPDLGHGESFVFEPRGPYTWPVDAYLITSTYGSRTDPVTGEASFHTGVDVATEAGLPVLAAATGTVTYADWQGNYGKTVVINNGGFRTLYGHLSVILVSQGEVVAAGDAIGLAGDTGKSTGPHLHFEWITDGHPVDPLPYYGG